MGDERSATDFDRKLGERVRARRLEIAMSQEELAERLGVTFPQIQKYEKGLNRIAAGRLWDVSIALNIPVVALFESAAGASAPHSNDHAGEVSAAMATPGANELVKLYASIASARVRRKVLELVRLMSEPAQGCS